MFAVSVLYCVPEKRGDYMKFKNSFHPYAMVTIVFWSLAYVLTRLTLQYFSAFSLGFLRYFVASGALLVIAVMTEMQLPRKQDILWFLVSGGIGFFFYMIAFNQGQATVTAATGSVVIATVPVITALFARFVYGEKLMRFQWGAIAVEFVGVAVLTLMNSTFSEHGSPLAFAGGSGFEYLQSAAAEADKDLYSPAGFVLQHSLWYLYACGLRTNSHSGGFTGTVHTVFLPCCFGSLFQCGCLCLLGKSLFQSKKNLSGQQLHVRNAFSYQHSRFSAGGGSTGQGDSGWRRYHPAGCISV